MLGNAADLFMTAQMRERVVAITPNGGGRSMQVPDRERPGTAHVTVKGGMRVPGPQRQVSSAFVPGMGTLAAPAAPPSPASMLPGMGCCAAMPLGGEMIPGMGGVMLPGMGELTNGKMLALFGCVLVTWLALREAKK